MMADTRDRLAPPPFWRTRYVALEVMARPDRRGIDVADVNRARSPGRRANGGSPMSACGIAIG